MKDKLSKKDVIWGYLAKGISMTSGLITLPLILHYLSQEEIALNYIFLSIMSIAALFDMGFSAQFSRNFAFVFGGGQDIVKKGVTENVSNEVNYRTLYLLIRAAKWIYFILSSLMAFAMLIGGTIYIYKFTEGFTLVPHTLPLWIAFTASVVFDFYYKFYTPLLMGENLIKEVNQIAVASTITKLIVLTVVILLGGRLWAVIAGNAASIVISRTFSVRTFYTDEIKSKLKDIKVEFSEIKTSISNLWYNAKRLAIVRVSTYLATNLSVIVSGMFLSAQDVSSLGLLTQLGALISTVATLMNGIHIPLYSTLRVSHKIKELYHYLTLSLGSFYILDILGGIGLLAFSKPVLNLIGSNATLPAMHIVVVYLIYKFLEDQHSICSVYLTTSNVIVDRHSSPINAFGVVLGYFIVLKYTNLGLFGMILVQLIVPLLYANWKWPWEVCKEFGVTYNRLVRDSLQTATHTALYTVRSFYFSKY